MKFGISAIALCLMLATAATAGELATRGGKQEQADQARTEACSNQVWPHFSPSCLRNDDREITVRLVTTDNRPGNTPVSRRE